MKKRTYFRIMREFANLHYKLGELTLSQYNQIITIFDDADERIALESEE